MTKHKWHDEIVAWAGGAEIECKNVLDANPNGWQTVYEPKWHIGSEYRIKPQPKEPKYLYAYSINNEVELDLMPNLNYNYIGKIEVQDD